MPEINLRGLGHLLRLAELLSVQTYPDYPQLILDALKRCYPKYHKKQKEKLFPRLILSIGPDNETQSNILKIHLSYDKMYDKIVDGVHKFLVLFYWCCVQKELDDIKELRKGDELLANVKYNSAKFNETTIFTEKEKKKAKHIYEAFTNNDNLKKLYGFYELVVEDRRVNQSSKNEATKDIIGQVNSDYLLDIFNNEKFDLKYYDYTGFVLKEKKNSGDEKRHMAVVLDADSVSFEYGPNQTDKLTYDYELLPIVLYLSLDIWCNEKIYDGYFSFNYADVEGWISQIGRVQAFGARRRK